MGSKLFLCFLTIVAIILSGCSSPSVELSQSIQNHSPSESESTILDVSVLDSVSKEPVENALVYIHNGYYSCRTDSYGKCEKNISIGSDYFGAYKKGYIRFLNKTIFEKNRNYLNIELVKLASDPISFVMDGNLKQIISAKGTRSESKSLMIIDTNGNSHYIFNELGLNVGFEKYIGKEVRITGYNGSGYVGWRQEEVQGVYVEEIIQVK